MRVLIVDDDPVQRKLLRVTLSGSGHIPVEAQDGVEALEVLRSGGFDSVITDVLMPRMDGYRLCHEIRRSDRLHDLPVLVYTSSYTSPSDEKLARTAGADEFVRKPASSATILEALDRIVRGPRPERPLPSAGGELEILKLYSEGLVRKLEEKNVELEAAHTKLAATNEDLRRSEGQVRLLLDSTAEGIYGLDLAGRITFSNVSCAELLGFDDPSELLEKNAHAWIHQKRLEGSLASTRETCGICQTLIDGEGHSSDDELFWRRGGTSFPAEYHSYPVRRDGELLGAVVTFSNVSERKRIEDALRKSEKRFSLAFHANPVATSIAEASTSKILDVNEQFLQILGYEREEVIGRTSTELNLWSDPIIRTRVVEEVLRDGKVRDRKTRLRTKSNDRRDVLGSVVRVDLGSMPCVLSTFVDVTDRERAEEALRTSEQRNRALMENAKDAIFVSSLDGIVLEVNRAAEDLIGRPRDRIVGRPLWETMAEEEREAVGRSFAETIARGGVEGFSTWALRDDGQRRPIEISASAVEVGGAKVVHAIVRDVSERWRAEKEIRRVQERFRRLFDANTIGIVVADLKGQTLEANDVYLEMIGYSREDLASGEIRGDKLTPPEYRLLDELAVRQLEKTGAAQTYEKELFRKDGTRVPVVIGMAMLAESEGRCLAYILDLTRIRMAEERLRDSESRYRLLFDASPQPMWVFDDETLAFLAVNDAACQHYGYTREEFLGMTIADIRPPEDRDRLARTLEAEPAGYHESGTWRHRRKDGSVLEVEITSHSLTFGDRRAQLVLALDVTERRRAEEDLRRSEERYRLLFEHNLAGVVQSTITGKILDCNDALVRIYGYDSREDVLSRTAADFYAESEDRARLMAGLLRDGSVSNFEVKGRRKDGGEIWVLCNYTLKDGSDREPILQGTLIEVTEKRRLEEQLQQSQKMEAVGQLAGGIAHDFNNILTTILGYGSLALERLDKKDPLFDEISEVQRAGERAAELTRKLLAFSRKQILEPRVIDLNSSIAGMEKMLRRVIGEDVVLQVRPAANLGSVRADPGQIEQVLLNLAVNSRDAMPRGGSLNIETANVVLDAEYTRAHAGLPTSGEFVLLAMSDTGGGMDASTQARIFEPFFTTKEPGKGTGLGLSTVYGIVKQSGGFIWCYSEPGVGTSFKVYLPHVREQAQPGPAPKPEKPPRGSETILVVEDEDTLAKLARRALERQGYRVFDARSGAAAREIAIAHPDVDLLLTDVVMPGMNGRELAEELQALMPRLKVVYMSGYTDDAIVHHGILEPGVAFLQKPFTPSGLAHKVREALGPSKAEEGRTEDPGAPPSKPKPGS